MAVSRFGMASNKKTALMKQQMREISKLLAENPPKEEKAKIRSEALIRDDGIVEAYEILQLSCELLAERIKLITASKSCPEDLKSTISTLIWASTRVDIKELNDVRKQFRSKFGKQFEKEALDDTEGVLNDRIVAKLSVQPPSAYLVQRYLENIAEQFGVDWTPVNKLRPEDMAAPMAAPVGYSVQVAPGTGLVPIAVPPEAYAVGGDSNGGGRLSDEVSEMGNTSSSILSNIGRGKGGGNKGFSGDDDAEGDIPVAEVMTSGTAAAGIQAESDIYLPPAPQNAKQDGIFIPPAPGAKTTGLDGDDSNFDTIQARFNNLKRP